MSRDRKRRISTWFTAKVLNPGLRWALERGIFPKTHALLETTGRKSGQPRRIPIGNGLRGDHFWIVTEPGHRAAYVKNIKANPRVRVKVGRSWYEGNAQILEDDDPRERMRMLGRTVNDALVRAVGTEQIVIRVDLDR